MSITIRYRSWPLDLKLDSVDLQRKREEMEKMSARVDKFRSCTFHILDNDWGFLPEDVYDAIDAADTRLMKMSDYCEESIEAIDAMLKAIETLEDNLFFVYEETDTVLKKGAA